jgi:tetratricopeptide (TPR) repeat protein
MPTLVLTPRLLLAAAAVSFALCTPMLAHGQKVPGYPDSLTAYDSREVAMLPKYCMYTQLFRDRVPGGSNADQINRWTSVMGDVFHHMHHYCYGLMSINRATILARDESTRRYYLNNANMEFDYVLERAPQDFVLLPEIHTKKGQVLMLEKRKPLALEQFQRAIELKPDYWPPYAYMSDHYREAGDLKKARELLEGGLSLSPDAKGLQRRLAEVDAESAKRKNSPKSDSKR